MWQHFQQREDPRQKPKGDKYVHDLRNHKNLNTNERKCCVHGKEKEKAMDVMDETEIDESGEVALLGQNPQDSVYSARTVCCGEGRTRSEQCDFRAV